MSALMKRLSNHVMQVEVAEPLAEICIEFPDLYVGKNNFKNNHLVLLSPLLHATIFISHIFVS